MAKIVEGVATEQGNAAADDREFAQALGLPADLANQLLKGSDEPAETETETETAAEETAEEEAAEESTEETETETETESEEETEEEEPKGIEAMRKRIDKITAARRTAEEERDALQIENASLKSKLGLERNPIASPNDPLADVQDEAGLNARVQNAQQIKAWAMKNLEGGTLPDGKGEEVEFSAEQVRDALSKADAVLTVHAPARADYLKVSKAIEEQALERYPELKNAGSMDSKVAEAVMRELPELKRFPNWRMVVGHIVAGLKQEKADAEAKAKGPVKKPVEAKTVTSVLNPKTKDPIAPSAPIRGDAALRTTTNNKERTREAKLNEVVGSGGGVNALAAAFAAMD